MLCFSEQERETLQKMICPWDSELIDVLLNGTKKIYQEMFQDVLLGEYKGYINMNS